MKLYKKSYSFYSDPGHGWLKVKKDKLVMLGIADKISSCSHMRGEDAYLEEDCDAPAFLNALKERGVGYEIKTFNTDKSSKIRSYESFKMEIPKVLDEDDDENVPMKLVKTAGMAILVPYDC